MFAGASPATGTAPVPVSGTICGLPVALSATLTFALFAPVVVGANFTPTLQLALAAKLLAPKGQRPRDRLSRSWALPMKIALYQRRSA